MTRLGVATGQPWLIQGGVGLTIIGLITVTLFKRRKVKNGKSKRVNKR